MEHLRSATRAWALAGAFILWLLGPSLAVAGTGFYLNITNNTNTAVTITKYTDSNWYDDDFTNPQTLAGKSSQRYYTEECSSILGCGTASHLQLTISDSAGEDIYLYIKGVLGDFPSWANAMQSYESHVGGVMAYNKVGQSGVVLISSLSCANAVSNDKTCTLTLDPATFSTILGKYNATTKEESARNYRLNGVMQTNGVVFNAQYVTNAVARVFNGRLVYANPGFAGLPLTGPTCPAGETSSLLYAVLIDWRMLVLPVCAEREIPVLPVTYRNGVFDPVDINKTFKETTAGPMMMTHSGLTGTADVRVAGIMTTDAGGTVLSISNDSGHFQPSPAALDVVVTYFRYGLGAGGAFAGTKSCDASGLSCKYTP